MKQFKVVWINLLMKCEYDADFKNGKPAHFTTELQAHKWARKQSRSLVMAAFRNYKVVPLS